MINVPLKFCAGSFNLFSMSSDESHSSQQNNLEDNESAEDDSHVETPEPVEKDNSVEQDDPDRTLSDDGEGIMWQVN